jgi:hypothetical protein
MVDYPAGSHVLKGLERPAVTFFILIDLREKRLFYHLVPRAYGSRYDRFNLFACAIGT